MNAEAKHELEEIANQLAYESLKHSGLYRLLSNEEWDAEAERLAAQTLSFVGGLVDREFKAREAAQRALAEDSFSRIERSIEAQDAHARRFGG